MMKNLVRKYIGVLLCFQIGLAPNLVHALDVAVNPPLAPAAPEIEAPAPPRLIGNHLNVPITPTETAVGTVDNVEIELGTQAQVEQNRPSLLAKRTMADRVVSFTSQYFYFQMVMGLSALVGLAMNYENDPVALQNHIKQYTSWDRAAESVVSFGAFVGADNLFQKFLRDYLKMNGPKSALAVQQMGMAVGLVMSTVVGELWNDKNIRLCAASRGTDLDKCDAAFDTWVKTDRIVQYIPMMIQNMASALISAELTKVLQKSARGVGKVKNVISDSITGKTEADRMAARLIKAAQPGFGERVTIRLRGLPIGSRAATAAWERGFLVFGRGFAGGLFGLGLFMAVDATVSSPAMKAYTKNYLAEQRSWLRRAKESVSTSSVWPLTSLSYGIYAGLSSIAPNYFPQFTDEKIKENWMKEFDLDTFLKFFRLWVKYNVAARKESGDISLINMIEPQQISKTLRDSKVVDFPQDNFEIIRDSHEALLSSLEYSKKDFWQTYDVSHCSPRLSNAAQLSFKEAIQFYIGLNKEEKKCLVDINVYDNLVSFIDRNTKHRNFLLSPLTNATSAWMQGLSKFQDMTKITYYTYRALIKSQFAVSHNETTYPGPRGPVNVTPLTYDGVKSLVLSNEAKSKHEVQCQEGDYVCKDSSESKDENFLPSFFGWNDGVAEVKISNNTDYLIAQMACGPSVKDTTAFYKELSSQTYENFFGKWTRKLGAGLELIYRAIPVLGYDEFRVFDEKMKDPNSAMIYTPAGLYPRFVPPRIVVGNGEICMHPKTGDQSVATGTWSDGKQEYKGLLPFVISHLQPEIMNDPKDPTGTNFVNWYDDNIQGPLDAGYEAFQGVFGRILKQELRVSLLRDKYTDGCRSGKNCLQSWKVHKVSLGVYQSMEVEIRVLLGMLNEIYMYPDEMMKKAREGDEQNALSTTSALKANLKGSMKPESLEMLDTRRTIFKYEVSSTTIPDPKANPMAPPELPKLFPKIQNPMPANLEQLKGFEIEFSRSFRAKVSDMSPDKNGLTSFNVEQSEKALADLQMFFTLSRLNEINDLQAKLAGLIFRALESLLQERNSYNNFLKAEKIEERLLDQPESMRKSGRDKLAKAFKPDNKEEASQPK